VPTFYRWLIVIGVLMLMLGMAVLFVGQILTIRAMVSSPDDVIRSQTSPTPSDLASDISASLIYSRVGFYVGAPLAVLGAVVALVTLIVYYWKGRSPT